VASVDLDIGGVQIDRHLLAQRRGPLRCPHREHRGIDVADPGLHRVPLPGGEPAREPGRGRGGQPAHRGEHLPAASARWRSSPTRKSSPASCAEANPTSNWPPEKPRSRALIDPIARSNSLIMFRRSTNSVTATIPDTGVSDGSGAPTRTRRRNRRISRTLPMANVWLSSARAIRRPCAEMKNAGVGAVGKRASR
jgi:hypothetical protein